MSNTVDQRIVQMRFDNAQFERNVSTTMSTLDKLKQRLNLNGASKGLENIGSAAKKVDMSGIGNAVDTVHSKFSALEVMGITALANITNQAVNAGKRMISALTIDPIISGYKEYETQIGAIQTILANTQKEGTDVTIVNKALDELNTYADKTIYNFTEMTRNIGTFTAAGVKLDTSVNAIKGIANLAAVSGSTSQQASTAMYQLSQALAAGKVSLMDWNSVVNAGMGGQVFQDALIRTSELLKTGAKDAIATAGSFRESLTKSGWLTTEVLTQTLDAFATAADTQEEYNAAVEKFVKQGYTREQAKEIADMARTAGEAATKVKTFSQLWDTMKEAVQSGWGQTWRMLIGDFEQAKERMTELSDMFGDIIGKSADKRNNWLEGGLSSSWDQLTRKLNAAGIETEAFQQKIIELSGTHRSEFEKMIEEEGSFEKALKRAFSEKILDKSVLSKAIKSFVGDLTGATDATGEMTSKMEEYAKVADEVINGKYGNGAERIKALTDAGYEYAAVQNIVNEKLGSSVRHLSSLSDEELKNANSLAAMSDETLKSKGYTEEQIKALRDLQKAANDSGSSIDELINDIYQDKPGGAELIWDSLMDILKSIIQPMQAVGKAWDEIFPKNPEALYNVIYALNQFTGAIANFATDSDNLDKITRSFKGLFAILDIITTIAGGGIKIAFKVLSAILGAFNLNVLDATAIVGDAIVAFRDWLFEGNALAKGINSTIEAIPGAVAAVKEWAKAFMELPEVQKIIEKFKDGFEDFKEIGKNVIEGLKNGLEDGIKSIPGILIELGKKLLEAIKGVLGIHSPSTKMYEIGENIIEGLVNGIKDRIEFVISIITIIGKAIVDSFKKINFKPAIDAIGDFVGGIVDRVREVFSGIDFNNIFAFGVSAILLSIIKKMANAFESLATTLEGLKDVFKSASKVLDKIGDGIFNVLNSFSKVIKAKAFEMKSRAIKNLAISLAILVGSLIVLAMAMERYDMQSAVLILLELTGILAGLVLAVTLLSKISGGTVKLGGLTATIAGIATSLLILSASMKIIGSMNQDQFDQGINGILGMMAGLSLIIVAFGTFVKGQSAKNINQLGKVLRSISITLLIMVGVCKLVGMLEEGEIIAGVSFAFAFLGFVWALNLINSTTNRNIDKLGSSLLKISAAMILMVGMCKLAGQLDETDLTNGAFVALGMGIFITGLCAINKFAGNQIPKVGATLLAISGALLIFIGVCKLAGMLNGNEIIKGIGFLAVFGIFTAALALIGKKLGTEVPKMAGNIIAMSIAIGILAGVCVMLSLIDLGGLAKGILAVSMLGAVMALMIYATKDAQDVKGNIMAMVAAIVALTVAVIALSFVDGAKLAGATIALSALMGMFALIAKASSGLNGAMGSLIVMTVAVGLLGGLIYLLSSLPIDHVFGVCVSLSAFLLSFAASLFIISKAGAIAPTALTAIVLLTAVVAALGFILYKLQDMDASQALIMAKSLSVLLLTMSGVCVVLGIVGYLAGSALAGLGILALLVVGVGAFLMGLGALQKYWEDGIKFLNEGIPILEKIGYAIGSFFGNIIGGFSAGAASGLPEMGKQLSAFMENAQGFIEGVKGVDASSVESVKSLVSMVSAVSGASIKEAIASWITGESSMDTFKTNLDKFADAITNFSSKITGKIDPEAVQAAASAGEMLAKMQSLIQGQGGVIQWFCGEKDLGVFASQIEAFGGAIVNFSNVITEGGGIDEEAVQAAASAGEIMTTLQSKVYGTGGVIQWFCGEKDLGTFGSQLEEFGKSIVTFSNTLTQNGGIDSKAVEAADDAGTMMATLQGKLVGTGGIVQWFCGEKDFVSFGTQIEAFGKSIVTFSNTLTEGNGIDTKAIKAAEKAGEMMSKLQGSIESTGVIVDFFTGKKDLSEFGTQMVEFAKSVVDFSNAITKGGVNEDAVQAAYDTGTLMANLQKAIPEEHWLDGKVSIDDFGGDIKTFGEKLAEYSKAVSGVDNNAVANSTQSANLLVNLAKKMTDLDPDAVNNFKAKKIGEAIKDYYGKVEDVDTSIVASSVSSAKNLVSLIKSLVGIDTSGIEAFKVDSIGKSMASYSESVSGIDPIRVLASVTAAKNLVSLIKSLAGIDVSGVASFKTAVDTLATVDVGKIANAFSGASVKMATAGADIINGIIKGMNSKKGMLTKAATDMVNSMIKPAKSKVPEFKKVGASIVGAFTSCVVSQKNKIANGFKIALGEAVRAVRTYYKNFKSAGEYLVDGVTEGIKNGKQDAVDAAEAVAKAVNDVIKEAWQINSPSKVAEEEGEYYGEGLAIGIEGSESMAAGAADELAQGVVDATEEGLTSGLSEVYKTSEEEQKAFWASMLATKQAGIDESKRKDMSIAEFEESILKDTMDIWKEYTDTLTSNSNSVMGQISLFDAVSKSEAVKKETLMKNLDDQIAKYNEFNVLITTLNQRITHDGLKETINSMGIDSIEQLKAINSMTDEELTKYANLYDTKYALAANIASQQMSKVRSDTEKKLSDLYGGVDVKLDTFATSFDGTMQSITDYVFTTAKTMEDTDSIGGQIVDNIANGIITSNSAEKAVESMMKKTSKKASDDAKQFKEPGEKSDIWTMLGINSKSEDVAEAAEGVGEKAAEALASDEVLEKAKTSGSNIVDGVIESINNGKDKVSSATESLGKTSVSGMNKGTDSHSPSREFMKAASYCVQGFVNGIKDGMGRVSDISDNLGSSAVKSFTDTISKISDVINGDMDTTPTIRPVLDLSNIESGSRLINSMFSGSKQMQLLSNVGAIDSSMNRNRQNGTTDDVISAINKLRKDLGNVGNTNYTINGITYDDGSNISEAIQSLVRAAKVERRI